MPEWQRPLKRGLDIVLSAAGLVILVIPLGLLALLIKLDSPGSVFFRHPRVGRGGMPFVPLKFRTMEENAMRRGHGTSVSAMDPRITRVGAFLRKWALDELPQLWNVLRGEMSLVGPRPTFGYQVGGYDDFQRRRLDVKPGITGWAQINGRNSIGWPERIEMDVWYVENGSLLLDLKILARTLWLAFVVREGVYGPAGVNPDFR